MGRVIKTRLDAQSKLRPGLYRGREAIMLRVCSASAQALQGGSLNGLKLSLCSLSSRQLAVPPVSLSTICTILFSWAARVCWSSPPLKTHRYPGKLQSFTSNAMGYFSLSVHLLFISSRLFSVRWPRYGMRKEIPVFRRCWGRGGVSLCNIIGLFLRNRQRKISVIAEKSCPIHML